MEFLSVIELENVITLKLQQQASYKQLGILVSCNISI